MIEKIDKAIQTAKGRIPSLTTQTDMQNGGQALYYLEQAKEIYATFNNPTPEFNEELAFLLGRVRANLGAIELMKVSAAVLNVMHAKEIHEALTQAAKPTKGPKPKTD